VAIPSVSGDAQAGVKSIEVSATVTRRNPDGSVRAVEDLGPVAYWHKNPVKRWFMNLFSVYKGER
jgi:hypothetical protein